MDNTGKIEKKKTGRPRIDINWDEFEKLCGMHCTQAEIADWFRCDVVTIENRCKVQYGKTFYNVYQEKKGKGNISLRRKQWQIALGGNVTMLIWLGKQYLDQKDARRTELTGADGKPLNVNAQTIKFDLSGRTPEELAQIQKTLLMLKGAVIENIKSDED